MCIQAALVPIGMALGATSATAAATGLAAVGTAVSVGGALYQGIETRNAAKEQAAALEIQRRDELRLAEIKDARIRKAYAAELAKQRVQIAHAGVSLDSPTALLLGADAAKEAAFASSANQQSAYARGTELSAAARAARSRGNLALFKGTVSAAGSIFDSAPDLWPGLYGTGSTGGGE